MREIAKEHEFILRMKSKKLKPEYMFKEKEQAFKTNSLR